MRSGATNLVGPQCPQVPQCLLHQIAFVNQWDAAVPQDLSRQTLWDLWYYCTMLHGLQVLCLLLLDGTLSGPSSPASAQCLGPWDLARVAHTPPHPSWTTTPPALSDRYKCVCFLIWKATLNILTKNLSDNFINILLNLLPIQEEVIHSYSNYV